MAMGDKIAARNLMGAAGVPIAPGTETPLRSAAAAAAAADRIGYPVMIKAAAGGGGMGMAVVDGPATFDADYAKVTGFAERLFGDPSVFVERFFPPGAARRGADSRLGRRGRAGARGAGLLGAAPQPEGGRGDPVAGADADRPGADAGRRPGRRRGGRLPGAGTVEFLLDPASGEFFFLEMNTRLQVEHPITEAVLGIDLVAEQLRIAAGEQPGFAGFPALPAPSGHAVELRINAEDPRRFLPGPGRITEWVEPSGPGIRVDSGYTAGNTVTPFYDSLMAKLVVHGADRAEALQRARGAVAGFAITGPKCNLAFHAELLANPEFRSGDYDTAWWRACGRDVALGRPAERPGGTSGGDTRGWCLPLSDRLGRFGPVRAGGAGGNVIRGPRPGFRHRTSSIIIIDTK